VHHPAHSGAAKIMEPETVILHLIGGPIMIAGTTVPVAVDYLTGVRQSGRQLLRHGRRLTSVQPASA